MILDVDVTSVAIYPCIIEHRNNCIQHADFPWINYIIWRFEYSVLHGKPFNAYNHVNDYKLHPCYRKIFDEKRWIINDLSQ
jgi:hypothetical protein